MDIKRYDTLLFNAIDLLLGDIDMDRHQICEELGMTEEEFESVGNIIMVMKGDN
jgi:hypothetical protein